MIVVDEGGRMAIMPPLSENKHHAFMRFLLTASVRPTNVDRNSLLDLKILVACGPSLLPVTP